MHTHFALIINFYKARNHHQIDFFKRACLNLIFSYPYGVKILLEKSYTHSHVIVFNFIDVSHVGNELYAKLYIELQLSTKAKPKQKLYFRIKY